MRLERSLRSISVSVEAPHDSETRIPRVKCPCSHPIDFGTQMGLVEPGGIEPPTSCMPCKRSPS